MAFIPVPDTAEVLLFYTLNGQQMMNTLYFSKSGGWDSTSLQVLADAAWDHWATSVMIDLGDGLVLTGTRALDLSSATGPVAEHTQSLNGSITDSPELPQNCAFAIKFTTAQRGRSFRGRIYLPGITTARQVSTGILSTSAADAFLEDVTGAIGDIATEASCEHVVVSRFTGGSPRVTGVATPVTGISYTDTNLDSQRRRLPGRGA